MPAKRYRLWSLTSLFAADLSPLVQKHHKIPRSTSLYKEKKRKSKIHASRWEIAAREREKKISQTASKNGSLRSTPRGIDEEGSKKGKEAAFRVGTKLIYLLLRHCQPLHHRRLFLSSGDQELDRTDASFSHGLVRVQLIYDFHPCLSKIL